MKKTITKRIKIENKILLYQYEIIIKTQTEHLYSVLILRGEYHGDKLIKEIVNGKIFYSYIVGIGKLKTKVSLISLITKKTNGHYFQNIHIAKNKTLYLTKLIDTQIFFANIEKISDIEKYKNIKKRFFNSSRTNLISKEDLENISNTTNILKYKVL